MKLNLSIKQHQTLTLKQVLTPQLVQRMKAYQLPIQAFSEWINQQASDNMMLEIQKPDLSSSSTHYSTATDDLSDYIGDEKGQTLQEKLMSQLSISDLDDTRYAIAESLIHSIDAQGYLPDFSNVSEDIQTKLNVAPRKVSDVLKIIQTFQPDGIGARSLKESLLIQLDAQQFEHEELYALFKTVISKHLEDIAQKNYETVAESCEVDTDAIIYIHEYFQDHFDPEPGLAYHTESKHKQIIQPSFEIQINEDNITFLNLERQNGVKAHVSPKYQTLLNDPQLDEESRKFITQQYQRAKEMVECVENRYRILDQLGQYIAHYQADYFRYGTAYLRPLLQKDLAKQVNVSPSTISRIVTSKYLLIKNETILLKTLCPRAYFGKTIEQLKRMISDLFKRYPDDSDQKAMLRCRRMGLKIARRTIAKYRLKNAIPPRYKRRQENRE